MQVYQNEPVIERLHAAGDRLRKGFMEAAAANGVQDHITIMGRSCNLLYGTTDNDGKPSQSFRTLFLQETIKRGLIMPSLVVCYSHSDADIDQTIEAISGAMAVYKQALDAGSTDRFLVGRPSEPVYRTYNAKK
jgi:glutamate-1-semialdehyde 2,1-aminomutase